MPGRTCCGSMLILTVVLRIDPTERVRFIVQMFASKSLLSVIHITSLNFA